MPWQSSWEQSGLKETDLQGLAPRLEAFHQGLAARRESGQLGFMELPYQTQVVKEVRQVAKPLLEWCWDVVVLGIGGSALGARALHQALCHPQHNKFPMARRHLKLGLWVADNIDPDYLYGLLDGLDMRRTAFNVISKSGNTAETLAQFLWIYHLLKGRVGEAKARERLVITTDPEKGPLRSLVAREHLASLAVPPNVGGRFSVLSAVGLLPAVLAGIEVEELLAGARFMDQRLKDAAPRPKSGLSPGRPLLSLCYRQSPAHPGVHALRQHPGRDGGLVLSTLGRKPGKTP